MSLTQINLKPYWDENTIDRMDVTIKITGLSYKEGERLCSMQLSTVTIPGCEPNALQICDESGAVLVKESISVSLAQMECAARHRGKCKD